MARFRLDLEYCGTRYSGWQVQKNARTVQGELNQAIAKASGRRDLATYGSGRTDAGVHALQQVAHLDLETRSPPEPLRLAINDALPHDIHVLDVLKVTRQFHARHSATERSYLYQISRRRSAFAKPYVWWVKDSLDAERMRAAASRFEGLRDFRSFMQADEEAGSTRVKLARVELAEAGDLILLRVLGSHFLWRMVRRMVGVLVEVGRGALEPEDVARFLAVASSVPAAHTAPPSGLFLERVLYAGELLDRPLVPVVGVTSSRRTPARRS